MADSQKYVQYLDAETAVVKRPEGPGWDDPFGDGVWRSSWFYSSLLIIKAKDQPTYGIMRERSGKVQRQPANYLPAKRWTQRRQT